MELDDPRWSELGTALGRGDRVPAILGAIAKMPTWNSGAWPPRAGDPLDDLWTAVFDQGDVWSAAFAIVPHLVQLAGRRTPGEQTVALLFLLHITFDAVRGAAPIPGDLVPPFEASLPDIILSAETCLRSGTVRGGSRGLALAARLLATKDLLAARIAHGIASPDGLVLRCPVCENGFEITWDDGWKAGGLAAGTATPGDPASIKRLAQLAAWGSQADLGPEYRRLSELPFRMLCAKCGVAQSILGMASFELQRRCPLANVPGWMVR